MLVAARTRVIGLLETPRRSKLAWLQEWIYFLDALIADETWLASCNFGSIHQKEFRLLGCNFEMTRLNFPCTRDHTHVKIEGKYTRPSATYTDQLAWMFASEITRAVNIKLRMQQYEEVNVFGLESVVSNDIAENLPWRPFQEWRWKKKDVHINIKETSAFGRLCYGLAVHSPKSKFSAGLDSFVSISAIVKGRSASYGLRPAIRRIGSTLIAGCLYPALHFFLTRSNKADHPTRNKDISDPVPNSVLQEKSLEEVVSRLPRFQGSRGSLPIGFGSLYSCSGSSLLGSVLKIAGASSTMPAVHTLSPGKALQPEMSAMISLTSTPPLDFREKGPLALPCFGFCPSFSPSLGAAILDFYLQSLLRAPVFCLLYLLFVCLGHRVSLSVCCLVVTSDDLSHSTAFAAPVAASHGQLFPRDKGDRSRFEQRKGIVLDKGRPVLAKTKDTREKLLKWFDDWLQSQGMTLKALLDPKSFDVETINIVLERHGRALYNGGRPYGHYSETINAVGSRRPNLRRVLQGAWNLAFTWLREEPPVHHVALPWQILVSLISVA